MIFEHFALNVENPIKMADWYVENCQMKIVKKSDHPHFVRFLSDKTGRVVIEIYNNKAAEKIKLLDKHHLEFHFAFQVNDAEHDKQKLLEAGAKELDNVKLGDGSHLVMLRDPFGIPLQLCQRSEKFMDIE